MERESENTKELEKQIRELQSALKAEKIKAGFLNQLIESANKQYGIDLQKINLPADMDSKNPHPEVILI